jgi:regulator of nonsense transcripts 2
MCSILASLSRVFPDLVEPVVEAYRREFYGMMKTKNQQYIDGKVRNVRFQAELVKFGLAPPITVFRMLRTLMSDFTPHNVELLGVLMETCGR